MRLPHQRRHRPVGGIEFRYGVTTSGHSVIFWKLCREVSGTDNCTSVRSDAV